MPLISGVTTLVTNIVAPGNSANAPGQAKQTEEETVVEETVPAETEDTAEPAAEEAAPATSGSNGLSRYSLYVAATQAAETPAETAAAASETASEKREDEVTAVDFARRAAIAAQAKASTQSLIDGMQNAAEEEVDPFEPLAKNDTSGKSAYANVNAAPSRTGGTYNGDA
ncbi:hypothetical protein ACRARG_00545 [Pseudooceanicola sp. C21-150M6]|uniref:hypothetical protein n=1 Tax=Pseudooceanicola sp. C21-150M6 TaxID=3434355 RepID=UPI003D7F7679